MISNFINNFHENIEGLRDFTSLIDPFLDDYNKEILEKHDKALLPFTIAREKFFAKTDDDKAKLDEQLREIFDGEIEVLIKEKPDSTENPHAIINSEDGTDRTLRFRVDGDTTAMDDAFKDLAKTTYHKELLFKNSLISLLSTVEWFFSQLLHYHYDKFPEAAGIKNKTLTLEDLKSFGSVKDAEDFLIENKIEDILRSSIKDWFKVLKDDLKLGLGYKDNYENELIEIYQRRNLFVHNGGIVNSIYFSKVSEDQKNGLKLGDTLQVTKSYLDNAITKLELIFTLIACELWKKLDDSDDERSFVLLDLSYKHLKNANWSISESANYFLLGDKKMPVANRTIAQLNYWLCKKEAGNYAGIKKEIEDADYSDKSLLFQVALAALRNDNEYFFGNISQVLKTEQMTPEELFEFPILREMREAVEFEKLKEESEIINDYLKTLAK